MNPGWSFVFCSCSAFMSEVVMTPPFPSGRAGSGYWLNRRGLLHVARVVPQPDGWLRQFVFVTHSAQACGTQHEKPAGRDFKTEPASRKYPQKMPAGKNKHVVADCPHALDDAVGPRADVTRR